MDYTLIGHNFYHSVFNLTIDCDQENNLMTIATFLFLFISGDYLMSEICREFKGSSIIAFPKSYCVVDIETTGLSPKYNHIIEIGAIRYDGGIEIERFQMLVQPPIMSNGKFVDDFIASLTGITNEMLVDAPDIKQVIEDFDSFLKDSIIVGYNVGFDINFLYDSYMEYLNKPLRNDFVNVLRFARKLHPEYPNHTLGLVSNRLGVNNLCSHRAIPDVLATEICFERLMKEALEKYSTEEAFANSFKRVYKDDHGVKASDIQGDDSKQDPSSPLFNRYCVFTGKLEKLTRKEAMQIVADLGGMNEDRVSKKTNFLVLGNNDYCSTIKDGKSSKQKQAEKLKLQGQDIEIIPETVFYDMVEDLLREWQIESSNQYFGFIFDD